MPDTQPNNLIIRLAKPKDKDRILQIQKESIEEICAEDYSAEQIQAVLEIKQLYNSRREKIEDIGEVVYVAEIGENIVGFSAYSGYWIGAVYVHPQHVRQGIGTKLVKGLEREALSRNIKTLAVSASITGKPFYQACGYEAFGRSHLSSRSGIYIPYIRMQKWLIPPSEIEQLAVDCVTAYLRFMDWILPGW